jgi:hypothetical protein
MTEPLITTCAGFSLQKVGGRCPKRDSCARFLAHVPGRGYPQESFLCAVGKWEMCIAVQFAEGEGHD